MEKEMINMEKETLVTLDESEENYKAQPKNMSNLVKETLVTLDDDEEVKDEHGLDEFHELVVRNYSLKYRINHAIVSFLLKFFRRITKYLENSLLKVEKIEYIGSSIDDIELRRIMNALKKINREAFGNYLKFASAAPRNVERINSIDYDQLLYSLTKIEKQNSFFGKLKRKIVGQVRKIKTKLWLEKDATI
jgi:hypothetical protein